MPGTLVAAQDFSSMAAGTRIADLANTGGAALPAPFASGDNFNRYGGEHGNISIQDGPGGEKWAVSHIGAVTGTIDGNNRAECVPGVTQTVGGIHAVCWDIYVPAGTPVRPSWNSFFQVKDQANEGIPLVAINFLGFGYNGYLVRSNAAGAPTVYAGGALQGEVERMCIAYKLAASGGWVSMWRNGVKVAGLDMRSWDNQSGSTKLAGSSSASYTKQGLYGDGSQAFPAQSVWWTNEKWATGATDVEAATAAGAFDAPAGGSTGGGGGGSTPVPSAPQNVHVGSVQQQPDGSSKATILFDAATNKTSVDRYFLYDVTAGDAGAPILNGGAPSATETIVYTFPASEAGTTRKIRVSCGEPDGLGGIKSSRDGGWSDPATDVPLPAISGATTPVVVPSKSALSFSLVAGGADSASQTFTVNFTNPGADTSWSIAPVSGFTISPLSGSNGATVTVTALASGRSEGAATPQTLVIDPGDAAAANASVVLNVTVGPSDESPAYPGWVTVIASRDPEVETGSYTLTRQDYDRVVEMTSASANTLTIPANASVAFPVGTELEVCQMGAGQTTIAPAAGVTLREREGKFKLAGQYATAVLRKRATNEWILSGDLTT